MVTVHYRRWCPPQSPLRIEFPPELLHDVRLEAAQRERRLPLRWIPRLNRAVTQSSGLLFGTRRDDEVRILAIRAAENLEPVGTFVCRERGEVFLTDDDLASFERHHAALALVVAGGKAGFFVRESDGSVQAIRSHEEFRVADAAPRAVPPRTDLPADSATPPPREWWQVRLRWKRIGACVAMLLLPAAGAFAYLRPLLPYMPIALTMRDEAGQLVIGWNARALPAGSRLEIQDGSERTILMLPANASSATYGRQGNDVQVRLSTDIRTGGAHWQAARFVTQIPRPETAFSAAQERIRRLTVEVDELRRAMASGKARARELGVKLAAAIREP
jgi:hypothetical protein